MATAPFMSMTVTNLAFIILCCTLLGNARVNTDGRGSAARRVGQGAYHHLNGVPIG